MTWTKVDEKCLVRRIRRRKRRSKRTRRIRGTRRIKRSLRTLHPVLRISRKTKGVLKKRYQMSTLTSKAHIP